MKKIAILFPGQGSQYVGMGREFLETSGEARQLMAMATTRSGMPLEQLCLSGPLEELTRVLHLQPAMTIINLICWHHLQRLVPELQPAFVAGHSLGEYSALHVAGVLSLEDTIALVTKRGELMEREGAAHPGGMRAVLGLTIQQVETVLNGYAGGGVAVVANYNSDKQVVISGDLTGLEAVSGLFKEQGAKVIALPVSVANHSPLVAGAVPDFAAFMTGVSFALPRTPLVFNVSARAESDPAKIREMMAGQIASRVRWFESIQKMIDAGVEMFIELGPKNVLTGLMKKILPRDSAILCVQADTPEALEKVAAQVK